MEVGAHRRLKSWRAGGILHDLGKAHLQAEQLIDIPPEISYSIHAVKKPQKRSTILLHKAIHTKADILSWIADRIAHFLENCSDAQTNLVFQNFEHAKGFIVPHMFVGYLKAVGNAWATTKRHGHDPDPCVFGCKEGIDSLKHYMICPFLLRPFESMFPQLPATSSMEQFLGLLVSNKTETLHCFLRADVTHYAYNTVVHSSNKECWPNVALHIKERVLSTLAESKKASRNTWPVPCLLPTPIGGPPP